MKDFSPKKYYIKTFGCSANVADSNTMRGLLDSIGLEEVSLNEKDFNNEKELLEKVFRMTDLFITNSCSVRQKSEDKVYGLGRILAESAREGNKKPFCVLAGCMVGSVSGDRQRYKFGELERKTSWVDAYMDPTQIYALPNLLAERDVLDEWSLKKLQALNKQLVFPKTNETKHGYVNISQGCDNFCTFCVVPYARGREVSRSEEEIIKEIEHLVVQGISEVTLCGQNVNSWGLSKGEKFRLRAGSNHKLPFAALLRRLHQLGGLQKIEFISSNPFDFTQDLIETLVLPKISNYLHIAVQSGNNDVLASMGRRHTIEEFLDLVNRIKEVRPDIELGTDIIVGFPGETREQFMDTVKLFQQVPFNVAFIAMYSPRKGTKAEKEYEDDVDREEKKWRHDYLMKVWKDSRPRE